MKSKLIMTGAELKPKSVSYVKDSGSGYIDMDFKIQLTSYGDFSKYFVNGRIDREKIIIDLMDGELRICGKKQI